MYNKSINAVFSVFLMWVPVSAFANMIDVVEYSSFIRASEFGSTSLQHTQVGYAVDEFSGAGLDVVFTNSLTTDNYGSVSWRMTNSTGMDLNDVWFYGFLDAHIDETATSFFNETGDAGSLVLGSGSGDVQADAWEIDEPGYLFGDIFTNLLSGSLDDTNALLGIEDDVSLALGFDIGTLLSSESILASFEISATNNGGLYHYDSVSDFGFYFTGSVSVLDSPVAGVSEPSSFFLMGLGFLLIGRFRELLYCSSHTTTIYPCREINRK